MRHWHTQTAGKSRSWTLTDGNHLYIYCICVCVCVQLWLGRWWWEPGQKREGVGPPRLNLNTSKLLSLLLSGDIIYIVTCAVQSPAYNGYAYMIHIDWQLSRRSSRPFVKWGGRKCWATSSFSGSVLLSKCWPLVSVFFLASRYRRWGDRERGSITLKRYLKGHTSTYPSV